MRRRALAATLGALVGGGFLAISDALSPGGLVSCGGSTDGSCPRPPLLTWSAIRPGWVAIGALAGAVLGLALHALQQREQRRRESVGEI